MAADTFDIRLAYAYIRMAPYMYVHRRMAKRSRTKVTLAVNGQLLERAKALANEKGIPLSHLVEKYFEFLVLRPVYCFSCGKKFEASKAEVHSECGWIVCPYCKACRCTLGDKEASVAFNLRKTFEDLAIGRVGV